MFKAHKTLVVSLAAGLLAVGSFAWAKAEGDVPKETPKAPAIVELPEAVTNAIKAEWPNAEIVKATARGKEDSKSYLVTFKSDNKGYNAALTAAGQITNVDSPVALADLPQAVQDAVKAADAEAIIKTATKAEQRTEGGNALDKPVVAYKLQLVKGNATASVRAKEDGTLAGEIVWKERAPKQPKPKPEPKPEAGE